MDGPQCRFCRLARAQYHSASGSHQCCCSTGIVSLKVGPHLNGDSEWTSVAQNSQVHQVQILYPGAYMAE